MRLEQLYVRKGSKSRLDRTGLGEMQAGMARRRPSAGRQGNLFNITIGNPVILGNQEKSSL